MIRYWPRFRIPDKAAYQINLAGKLSPNINPVSGNAADLMIDVETPDGKTLAIDDLPAQQLIAAAEAEHMAAAADVGLDVDVPTLRANKGEIADRRLGTRQDDDAGGCRDRFALPDPD